jgi:hypothetical protein
VFATNSLSCLPDTDFIIVLKEGYIQECGTYAELKNNGGEFAELLADNIGDEQQKDCASVERTGKSNSPSIISFDLNFMTHHNTSRMSV